MNATSHMEAEVLVVGAGPAGIAAATAAARHKRNVLLVDDNAAPGGQIWRGGIAAPRAKADPGKHRALEALRASGATVLAGWQVFDAPAKNKLRIVRESSGVEALDAEIAAVHYRHLVIATGARERFLPFPGWTRPGVFGAGGLQALVKGGFNVAGKRVVVAGSGPLLLAVAAHLAEHGAKIVTVAEQASLRQLLPFAASLWSSPAKIQQGIRYRAKLAGTPYRTGCWPMAALGADWVTGVRLTDGVKTWEETCDLLACGFHLVPNTELAALLGCGFRGEFVSVDQWQRTSLPDVFCVGEPTGIGGLDAALVQGEIAGLICVGRKDEAAGLQSRRTKEQTFAASLDNAFRLRPELRTLPADDTIVCRCEDVPYSALAGKASQFDGWTSAKMQTRCGMGACQGRTCGPAVDFLFGWRPNSIRPPLVPVPLHAFCQSDYAGGSATEGSTEVSRERR
jgi:D-hydroxyproline dehydrogenase subunit alpha